MKWEELPLADRAQLMAAAVRNGYTDIRSIKAAYANFQNQRQQTGNRYDEGGSVNTDEDTYHDSFYEWKNAISEHMGLDIDNDRTYDYMSFYYDNPAKAWAMVNGDPDAHFTDRFKTAEHPTFSTESDLSGKYDPINNPLVATGGTWTENPNTFTLPTDWYKGPSIPERISYLENAENNGVTMFMPDGSLPTLYNNEPWGGVLPELTVTNQKAYGGNLFKTGGNKGKKKGITQQELQRRKNYYRQQLIIRGLRGAQLEAVLANMEVESTFDPGAHNDASGARGLMQWLGSRKPKSWSEKDQLDYIAATYNRFGGNEWLDKKAWKRFNETTDPAEAARLFRRYWERPERSSWNATDALFKNSKGSYLPQDVNDLVAQVSSLQYDEPKAPVFTEEDQRLLDTPALAIVNPEYEDTQDPDYKPSALQESIKLDESLWRDPANNWALYNQFANMQQGSSQDDPLGWMTTMASLSPNTTPQQKEAASTMYQLFAPQDGDYSYHGLNFAAYGGKVNRFDGYGDSHLNAVRSSNPRRDGYYIADGAGTRREITYEQALELAKNNPNLVVNYYKDNVGGTGRLHWDENQNQFVDNNEYFGKELDNVDVVKFVNQPIRQLTDAIPTISTPILEYRSDITPYVDFTNTDQNMFHRRDAANADSAVREALSSDVIDHVYDYMMPSTWAGAADKLFDHDENGNLKYSFFTDFNKVFNTAYDNQGFVGLVGADEWADEHPEATALINTGVDLALPFGIKGVKNIASSANKAGKSTRLNEITMPIYYRGKPTQSVIPGFQFLRNFVNDVKNPKIGLSGIWDLTKSGDYAWLPSRIRRSKEIEQVIRDAQSQQLNRMALSTELKAGRSRDFNKLSQIAQAKSDIGKYKINTPGNFWYYWNNNKDALGSTDTGVREFWFPMTKNPGTNVLRTAEDWLNNSRLRHTLFHEPVHAAQKDLFPAMFGKRNGTVFVANTEPEVYNPQFIGYRNAEELASHGYHQPGVEFNGINQGNTLFGNYSEMPWERQWVEFNADANGYAAAHGYPSWNLMNSSQKMDLVDYLYRRFGNLNGHINPEITRLQLYKLAKQDGFRGLMANGGTIG